jgi:phosphoesterase RecJ-like protein
MSITMEEAEKFKLSTGDKEGVVNLPLAMKDVHVAALFTEDKDKIKISFRSKGAINVDEFARKHFNGGGHKNASGGYTNLSLPATIELFQKAIAEFKQL